MIPHGWTERSLRDVFKLASGESRPKDIRDHPEPAYPSPVYGGNGIIGYSSVHNASGADIIIGRVGEYCGVTRIVRGPKWITDNALYAKTVRPDVDRDYLALRLQYFDLSNLRSKGGQPLVSQEPIYAQNFAFPPIEEQQSIVSIIALWDRAIETVEGLIANAHAQKASLMQQLLNRKRRLPGFSNEWKAATLGERGDFRKGRGISRAEVKEVGIPSVRYGEIYTYHHDIVRSFGSFIDSTSASLSEPILRGDILFACSGETAEEIGKCVAYLGDHEAYAGGDIVIFSPERDSPVFLAYLLNSPQLVKQKSQMGQGNAVVHISASNLAKLQFVIPERGEQDEIALRFLGSDAQIHAHETQLAAFRQEKAALVQHLLTGKRRVRAPAEAA